MASTSLNLSDELKQRAATAAQELGISTDDVHAMALANRDGEYATIVDTENVPGALAAQVSTNDLLR
ncbi:MAG: hypothetical protein QFF03_10530 [Pseudomonadota bacterium]|nr:hypothetical protein [Pseudomonadota bacterium]